MGPVERTVTALAQQVGAACQVVVICGRNKRLVRRLEARQYPEGMKVVVTGGLGALAGESACNMDTGSLQVAGCLFVQQREYLRRVGLPGTQAEMAAFAVGSCSRRHALRPGVWLQLVVCRCMGLQLAGQAVQVHGVAACWPGCAGEQG